MNDLNQFRPINENEKQIVRAALSDIILKPDEIIKNLFVFFVTGKNPSIFFIYDDLSTELEKLSSIGILISAGLDFGFIKKSKFYLSLEAVEFLNNRNKLNEDFCLILNKNGEKSILYGNDVQKKMVQTIPKRTNKNKPLIIFNENKELLAFALSKIDFKEYNLLDQDEIIAKTLVNKGSYLRRKQ